MHLFRSRSRKNAMLGPPRWKCLSYDEARAASLAQRLGIHPAVARALAARGWGREAEAVDQFLAPALASLRDPFELQDMERGVDRAIQAIERGEKICVFGDYDVDGVSSTAIMVLALRFLGADPAAFIPHRIDDGYGMKMDSVERLAAEGVRLIITVDNGICAGREIARANDLGMEVVVTDHHLADEGELPAAVAIINPNRPDVAYEHGRLCGAGVAFKFAHAMLKRAGADPAEARGFLKDLMDLVALGTVADMVPLLGENRVLARHGLEALRTTRRPGLRALFDVARIDPAKKFGADTIGFGLGPRINAAGRTEHGEIALELLLTEDAARAVELAKYLDTLNKRRRDEESLILNDAVARAEEQLATGLDSMLVVGGGDYHLGVVGIVAARLVERFNKPAIVLRIDQEEAKGSARSIDGFDLHIALGACAEHLLGFGGHAAAAGLQIHPSRIESFREAINEYASSALAEIDPTPEVMIDAEVFPGEIGWALYDDVQRMQPFGQDNPAPNFMMRGVTAAREPRIVGTNHLKVDLQVGGSRIPAIGFGLGESLPMLTGPGKPPVDILFRPSRNEWNGRTTLEFELKHIRPAG